MFGSAFTKGFHSFMARGSSISGNIFSGGAKMWIDREKLHSFGFVEA
jgi:hypothetical protein